MAQKTRQDGDTCQIKYFTIQRHVALKTKGHDDTWQSRCAMDIDTWETYPIWITSHGIQH